MRDYQQFPKDDNGDVLFDMMQDGDDLSRPRDIDFAVVFQDLENARAFADHCGELDATLEVIESENDDDEMVWDVIVTKHMFPTHKAITEFENTLETLAANHDGHNDGWGCVAQ